MEMVNTKECVTIDARLIIICKECRNRVEVEPEIELKYCEYYPDDSPEVVVKAKCTICDTEYETNIY